jgi:hypothetical protein
MYEMQGPHPAWLRGEPISQLPNRQANRFLSRPTTWQPISQPPGPRLTDHLWRLPGQRAGFPALGPFPESPPGPTTALVVNEVLQLRRDQAQGFAGTNLKIFWPSTGHRGLSPAISAVSTVASTASSTGRAQWRPACRNNGPAQKSSASGAPDDSSIAEVPGWAGGWHGLRHAGVVRYPGARAGCQQDRH